MSLTIPWHFLNISWTFPYILMVNASRLGGESRGRDIYRTNTFALTASAQHTGSIFRGQQPFQAQENLWIFEFLSFLKPRKIFGKHHMYIPRSEFAGSYPIPPWGCNGHVIALIWEYFYFDNKYGTVRVHFFCTIGQFFFNKRKGG